MQNSNPHPHPRSSTSTHTHERDLAVTLAQISSRSVRELVSSVGTLLPCRRKCSSLRLRPDSTQTVELYFISVCYRIDSLGFVPNRIATRQGIIQIRRPCPVDRSKQPHWFAKASFLFHVQSLEAIQVPHCCQVMVELINVFPSTVSHRAQHARKLFIPQRRAV